MEQIRKAGERAAALTRQLLAFGRKQILAPVVLDLNSLLTEIEKMLRRLIGADIELTTILQPGLGRVKVDPGQIEQIIMNLVVNARDAMPTGGRLTIQTHNTVLSELQVRQHPDLPPGPYTLLAVSDTGSGMDEATKARIFEPFFTTKEVGKGTGLGLATVFGIVKQSGGFIEVDSALGSGSTFRIYLPQIREATRLKEADHGLVKMPRGMETILLVEDEDGLRELAQLILEASGYKVLSTRNGGEAVQVCHEYADDIQLLFTDVVMPKMSGRQLTDLLVPSRPNMKVLYMSGYTDDTMVRHGIQDAGTNFLAKPFTPVALAQKVREVLDGTNGRKGVESPLAEARFVVLEVLAWITAPGVVRLEGWVASMFEFLTDLFDTSDFPARWRCGAWTAAHGWLHILSDLGVWSAYLAIPCVLVYFALRRRDLPFKFLFLLFGAFILACGTTHLMEAVIFWWPAYRLAGASQAVHGARLLGNGLCPDPHRSEGVRPAQPPGTGTRSE